ncbi:MAG: hypothetical protein BWX88_04966 [Planctomycetes bacterium ADurb.Bin126]|nr:MAG: hypothetical protein BWX88_04966 [Planctomycetes bacterium ADurb.Bin126]
MLSDMMNNPPAFSRPASRGNNYVTGEEDVVVDPQRGMTLLDYFAARAMQAMVACEPWGEERTMASRAYSIAEAMLAERTHRV